MTTNTAMRRMKRILFWMTEMDRKWRVERWKYRELVTDEFEGVIV
jgi:hypothetical protein